MNWMPEIIDKNLLFNSDDYYNSNEPGYIEYYDFTAANDLHETRVAAVSKVASVCYGNEGLKPNFKLFNKLTRESIGLPSSSFEFIPVFIPFEIVNIWEYLFKKYYTCNLEDDIDNIFNIERYGFKYDDGILTNLRAVYYDLIQFKSIIEVHDIPTNYKIEKLLNIDNYLTTSNFIKLFITEDEIYNYLKEYRIFKIKMTIRDARQFLRHRRASYQELSRRYTSGDKVPFEFRYNKELVDLFPNIINEDQQRVDSYNDLTKIGKLKAQIARDILPVNIYTTIWVAFLPDGLANFLELRTKSSAQKEIREIALKMQEILEKHD